MKKQNQKFSNQYPLICLQGFLTPKSLPSSGKPEKYQLVCGQGENYLLDASDLWNDLFEQLCWRNVVVNGFYNKKKRVIELAYMAKNDEYKPLKGYSGLASEEERDLSFYQQRIHNTGVLETAA